MNKISCDVCLDLIPLVKDDIASADSKEAVFAHIANCESCLQVYGEEKLPPSLSVDQNKIFAKIKKKLFILSIVIIAAGMLIGAALTDSMGMFYNIIIFPSVGALSFFTLRKRSLLTPIVLFFLTFALTGIKYFLDPSFAGQPLFELFYSSALWSLIYASLCLLGVIIGFLLYIAFRKEKSRMKIYVKIIAGIVAFSLIFLLLAFANSLVGNPVSKLIVKINAQNYLEDTYSDPSLYIDDVIFNFKTNGYTVKVVSNKSEDTHFSLSYSQIGKLKYDTYESSVKNRYNTYYRINDEYSDMFENAEEKSDFLYDINFAYAQIKDISDGKETPFSPIYGIDKATLVLDKKYDVNALAKISGLLVVYAYTDNISVKKASDMLLSIKNELDDAKVNFYAIDFTLYERADDEEKAVLDPSISVKDFLYSDIYEDDLVSRVQSASDKLQEYYEALDKEDMLEKEKQESTK